MRTNYNALFRSDCTTRIMATQVLAPLDIEVGMVRVPHMYA